MCCCAGKTWDKATKLAVLPVVFFQHQSCKPAPEPVTRTDTVPTSEQSPTSPEAAAEAASKPASPPSPDLAKTVNSAHPSKIGVFPAVLHGNLFLTPLKRERMHEPLRCH